MQSRMIKKQKGAICKTHRSKVAFFKKSGGKLEFLCEQCLKLNVGMMEVKSIKGMKGQLEKGIERYQRSIKSGVVERMNEIIGKKINQIKNILNGQFQKLEQKDNQISLDLRRVEDQDQDYVVRVQKWENMIKRIEQVNQIAQRNQNINQKRLIKLNQFYYFFKNSEHWLQQALNYLSKLQPQQQKLNPITSPLLSQITRLIATNEQQSQRQISSAYKTINLLKQQISSYQRQLQSNSITIDTLEQQLAMRIHNYLRMQKQLDKHLKSNPSSINNDTINQLSVLTRKFNDCKSLLRQKDTLLFSQNQFIRKITQSYEDLKIQFQKEITKQNQQKSWGKVLPSQKSNENKNYVQELQEEINKLNRSNMDKDNINREYLKNIQKLENQNSLQTIQIQRLLQIIQEMKLDNGKKIQQVIKLKSVISEVLEQNNQQNCENEIKRNPQMHISYLLKDSIVSQPINVSIQKQQPKVIEQYSSKNNCSEAKMLQNSQNYSDFSDPTSLIAVNKTKKYSTTYQKTNSIKQTLNSQNEHIIKKEEQPLIQPRNHQQNEYFQQQENIERKKYKEPINELDQMVYGNKKPTKIENKNNQQLSQNVNYISQQKSAKKGSAKIQTSIINQQQYKPYQSVVFPKSKIIYEQSIQMRLLNCFFEEELSINQTKMHYSSVLQKMSLSSINTLLNFGNVLVLTLSNTNITRGIYFRQPLRDLRQSTQKCRLPLLLMHTQTQNLFLKLVEDKSSYSQIILHFVRQDNPNFSFIFRFFLQQAKIILEIKIIEKNRIGSVIPSKKQERIEILEIFQLKT